MLDMDVEGLMVMRFGKQGLDLLFNTSQKMDIRNLRCISQHGAQLIIASYKQSINLRQQSWVLEHSFKQS